MALHDRDKNSDKRLTPMPTARDINTNRMAHGTTAFTLKGEDTDQTVGKLVIKDGRLALETNQNTFIDLSNGNIEIKRTDGNIMGRLGYDPDDTEGKVKIAKSSTSL
jgi:hypothetical protein